MDLVASICKVTDPVGGNGGAGIDYVEDFHALELYVIARRGETGYIIKLMGKGSILIVEDNMDNYELVRFVLERAGYDVFLAVNGRDGVDAARFQKPDLILMDLGMPEMDGWMAAEKIKQDPSTSSIPLYAITAHTLPRDRYRALQAGYDGYISKPIHVQSFLEMINKAFEKLGKK